MKENYTLFINSKNSTNRIGTNKYSYQYNINWKSVLPQLHYDVNQQFLVRFIFTNTNSNAIVTDIYSLYIDFGIENMYDQSNSSSSFLGLIYPVATSTNGYTQSNFLNNLPVTIEYPNNSLITVNIVNISNVTTTYAIDYNLILEFTPI